MTRRAIIDIGTNTAHLLVGEIADGKLQVLTKKRHYTFLGEDGLEHISEGAIQRLRLALVDFDIIIKKWQCKNVHIIATEGLRRANNRADIISIFDEIYRWNHTIISGHQEAEYIYRGTSQSWQESDTPTLVVDIGGGSVEFILSDKGKIIYQRSHPIGISRLYDNFHQIDPILVEDIHRMYDHLDEELIHLWTAIQGMSDAPTLIGCAGTFEVLLQEKDQMDEKVVSKKVPTTKLLSLLSSVIHKTIDERKIVSDLPPERANYIVVALLLMNYIVKQLSATTIVVSKYALKEGAILDDDLFLD